MPQRRGLSGQQAGSARRRGRNGCDDETVRALRGIPPETYNNLGQVAASVTSADERDGDGAKKAATESPIVDELGENRGS